MAEPARPFLFVVALSVLVMTALYPLIAFALRCEESWSILPLTDRCGSAATPMNSARSTGTWEQPVS